MKKGLSAKDLINVGIYTAIYLVLFFVVGMMNAIPILYPAIYLLIPIVTGIPFMYVSNLIVIGVYCWV